MIHRKYTCPLCGNKDFEPIELLSRGGMSWVPIGETIIAKLFEARPMTALACTECRHILFFADDDKHERRS